MQDSADAALAALRVEGSTVERLDRYVQHAYGDGYEALSATPFGAELMDVRHQFAADVADAATARTRQGLRAFVGELSTVGATTRTELIDLLVLAPTGLKGDNPSPRIYRRRLRTLAAAAARLLDAGWPAANTREPAGIDDVDVVNTPHPENPR
jgi:hypothetical protein